MHICFILYIDPGTGSIVIQTIIASILGITFYIKSKFPKIKKKFFKLIGRKFADKVSDDEK